jgi:hypothetical protein
VKFRNRNKTPRDTVAGRQEGAREIKSAAVKQTNLKNGFKKYHIAPGVRPEKGHLFPDVKMANEIVYDHIWDKP